MERKIRRILLAFVTGIGIGYIITIITSIIFGNGYYSPGVPSFLQEFDKEIYGVIISSVLYGLLGVSGILYKKIYGLKISLFLRTLAHMFLQLISIMLVGKYLHWFVLSPKSIFYFMLIFFLIYIIIWTIQYFIIKKEIVEINKKLN